MTTDENRWIDLPTSVYIIKPIPAELLNNDKGTKKNAVVDVGTYILSIDDNEFKTPQEFERIINLTNQKDKILIKVFNVHLFKTERFVININQLNDLSNNTGNNEQPDRNDSINKNWIFNHVRYIDSAVLIVNIQKDGASDRAGIKQGDIVTKINNKKFKNGIEADDQLRAGEAGKIIKYNVLRNNEQLEINVELAAFGASFSYLTIFIIGLAFFGFGIFVSLKKPELVPARIFGLTFIIFGFTLTSSPLVSYRVYFDMDALSIILFLVGNIALAATPAMLIYLSLNFPLVRYDLIEKKWIWLIPLIFGFIYFIITSVIFLFFLDIPSIMLFYNVINILIVTSFVYKTIQIIITRKKSTKEYRKMSLPILIGWSLFPVLFTIQFIRSLIFRTEGIEGLQVIGLFVVFLAYLYIIGKYRLLDLNIRLKRNIQYFLASLLLKLIVVAAIVICLIIISNQEIQFPNLHLTGTNIEVLENPLNEKANGFYEKLLLTIFSMGSLLILWKGSNYLQKKLDEKYFMGGFDYKKATTEFADIFAKNLEIKDLARGLIDKMKILFKLNAAGMIFFRKEEKICGLEYYGFSNEIFDKYCILNGFELVDTIKQFQREFRVDYLPENIKVAFKEAGFVYLIPIRSKGNVIGALLVGEKLSEDSYTREDLDFFTSIAGQTFIAIENAFLYEELAEQDRIKHELEIARKIQLSSLPNSFPDIEGLSISGISIPALEVGGDFFDFLVNGSDNELTVIVGDVSGKGTSSALYMSQIQGILRTLNEFDSSPKKLLIRTNKLMSKYLEKNYFITVIGVRINTLEKKFLMSRAGHLPLYLYQKGDDRVVTIKSKGMMIGPNKEVQFEENLEEIILNYSSGDIMLFVTDGVTEAMNEMNIEFGDEKLMEIIKNNAENSPRVIRDRIIESVKAFSANGSLFDDMTIVVIKAD